MTRIFLSYAGPDRDVVRSVYERLSTAGFTPWMAPKDIKFGEDWEYAIKEAMKQSDFCMVCLTKNSNKRGYLQEEIKQAIDIWRRMFQSDIYLIPARLEECEVPDSLRGFQRADLFVDGEWEKLIKSFEEGMLRRLPASEHSQKDHNRNTNIPTLQNLSTSRSVQHVLLVEDDRKQVIFIVDQLEAMGFAITVAHNGLDGLEHATSQIPSLIILDIMLPKMDGYEVCRRLKTNPATEHIPILMLSARGPLKDTQVALKLGADDYLAKPYDIDVLEARVRNLLDRSYPREAKNA